MIRSAAIVVALAAVGCGDDGAALPDATPVDALPPDAPPREVITSTQALEPTQLVEGIMTAGPGDVAVIELSAADDLGFNIHGHANGGTQVVYTEQGFRTTRYVFVPSAASDWYLLVRNESNLNLDVSIRVELYGAMTWRWQ